MLDSPGVGLPTAALGEAVRFESSLAPVLGEVAFLAVGAHWRSEYEFWAHSRIGADVGLAKEFIEAVAVGAVPADAGPEARLVHGMSVLLLLHGRLDGKPTTRRAWNSSARREWWTWWRWWAIPH